MRNRIWTLAWLMTAVISAGCGAGSAGDQDGFIQRCAEAAGGREALESLRVIHTVDSIEMAGMRGMTESWWIRDPFTGLSVTELGPVRQEVLMAGDSVWTVDRNGHLSPGGVEQRDQMELSRMTVFYDHLLDPSLVTLGADTVLDSVLTVPVMLQNQPNVVFYFSSETCLPVMMTAVTMGIEVRSYPGQYTEVDGIVTPLYSLSTIPAMGQEIESRNVLTEYNVAVPESIFVLSAGTGDWELAEQGASAPMELRGEHIYLTGAVNGVPVNVLLDSGAGATLLDSSMAEELGLVGTGRLPARGIGGTREFSFVEVENYQAAGAVITGQQLAVMPLSEEFYPSTGQHIDMILGYDFLSRFVTEIDYGSETIRLWSPDSAPPPPEISAVLPAERSMSLLSIQAVLEDSVQVRLLLDTGAGGNIHLTPSFFSDHPSFLGGRPEFETEIQGVGGSETIRGFRVSSVSLGDFTVPGGLCSSFLGGDIFSSYDGIVGNGILSRFVLRLDYGAGEVTLRPSSLYEEGLPETLTGLGLEIHEGRLRARTVIPDSPAADAGILPGDIILEVDGEPVAAMHLAVMDTIFPDIEGSSAEILLERGGAETESHLVTRRLVP